MILCYAYININGIYILYIYIYIKNVMGHNKYNNKTVYLTKKYHTCTKTTTIIRIHTNTMYTYNCIYIFFFIFFFYDKKCIHI